MRTDDKIIDKMAEVETYDWLGIIRSDLVQFLPFDRAKDFLIDEATRDNWTPSPNTTEHILKEMLDYMPFAWDKANGCRGISAGRSLNHYEAWLWLLGDPLANELRDYEHIWRENDQFYAMTNDGQVYIREERDEGNGIECYWIEESQVTLP